MCRVHELEAVSRMACRVNSGSPKSSAVDRTALLAAGWSVPAVRTATEHWPHLVVRPVFSPPPPLSAGQGPVVIPCKKTARLLLPPLCSMNGCWMRSSGLTGFPGRRTGRPGDALPYSRRNAGWYPKAVTGVIGTNRRRLTPERISFVGTVLDGIHNQIDETFCFSPL